MATLAKRNSANDNLVLSEGIEDYWSIRDDDPISIEDIAYDDWAGCTSNVPCFECPFNDYLCWLWAW